MDHTFTIDEPDISLEDTQELISQAVQTALELPYWTQQALCLMVETLDLTEAHLSLTWEQRLLLIIARFLAVLPHDRITH